MEMAGGKVRTRRGSQEIMSDAFMTGFNSNGQKGIFPSNYVCPRLIVIRL
jgi:hypothetical protein